MTLNVLTEWQTVQAVAAGRLNLARYGDGEYKLAQGRDCKTQPHSTPLRLKLREILRSGDKRLLVAVPRIFEAIPPLSSPGFWVQYTAPELTKLHKGSKIYGSAFVSRRDAWPIPNEAAYWQLLRTIWSDRAVLLVTGTRKGRRTATGGLLDNAASVDVLDAPRYDAFASYDALLADCWLWAAQQRDPLVIAACGATATVLAADLAKDGIQCLDLGHAAQAHARMDPSEDEAA